MMSLERAKYLNRTRAGTRPRTSQLSKTFYHKQRRFSPNSSKHKWKKQINIEKQRPISVNSTFYGKRPISVNYIIANSSQRFPLITNECDRSRTKSSWFITKLQTVNDRSIKKENATISTKMRQYELNRTNINNSKQDFDETYDKLKERLVSFASRIDSMLAKEPVIENIKINESYRVCIKPNMKTQYKLFCKNKSIPLRVKILTMRGV